MRRQPTVITTSEFQRVDLPPPFDTAQTRERIETAALNAGFNAFEIRRGRLYARGVVGVVDVGNLVVEVLPKVGATSSSADDVAFLDLLLRYAGAAADFGVSQTRVAIGNGGLLELVLGWAANLLAREVRRGLPRRYVWQEDVSTAVRGRVQLRSLVRQRPGRAFEVTIRHAPLDVDNIIGRTLRWLAGEIGRRSRRVATRVLCAGLDAELSGISNVAPALRDIEAIELSPFEEHWQPLLDLAHLFLRQGTPDPSRGGSLPAIAILFSMHVLFERAVRHVLADGFATSALTLRRPGSHLLATPTGDTSVRLKPDFVFAHRHDHTVAIVGDAKWKGIVFDQARARLSEADAYQITAYMAALQAPAAFIAAPLTGDGAATALRDLPYVVRGLERPMSILGIHLPTLVADGEAGAQLRDCLCQAVATLGRGHVVSRST